MHVFMNVKARITVQNPIGAGVEGVQISQDGSRLVLDNNIFGIPVNYKQVNWSLVQHLLSIPLHILIFYSGILCILNFNFMLSFAVLFY